MALTPGTRLGPYEVTAQIGAGGMGEVYRALDTTLGRHVAIKVLPDTFSADSDRLARFEREARTLAALNHPGIAHIYGVENTAGVRALVMELVEGETLAERIARGPIPVPEAMAIARQIAEALEAAHEQGIIHRDLKPANVKLRPDGIVKVLDFGLAKALGSDSVESSLANSPTMSLGATRAGVILGTAAYMSPEQANGYAVDRRADIWSFGAVLYEMLAGSRAFPGESVSDTLATVLKIDPDWKALPAATPSAIRTLLRRCLTRDRKQRLQAIGEARIALESPAESTSVAPVQSHARLAVVATVAAAVFALAFTGIAFVHFGEKPADVAPVERFEIPMPSPDSTAAVVSPDGSQLLFFPAGRGVPGPRTQQLFVRRIDSTDARPLQGTEGAVGIPFWSADGRYVAFTSRDRKLKRIDVTNGIVQVLGEAIVTLGGFWTANDTIVFSNGGRLVQVPASGGTAIALGGLKESDAEDRLPILLPDGRHFVFLRGGPTAPEGWASYVASLDDKTAAPTKLTDGLVQGFAPSNDDPSSGYLLFLENVSTDGGRAVPAGTLMAQRFDVSRMKAVGAPVPIGERFQLASVSRNGILVYTKGTGERGDQLTIFDRGGNTIQTLGEPDDYSRVSFSPDGSKVVATRGIGGRRGGARQLWMFDLVRGIPKRFSTNPDSSASFPVWSPDGNRIVFASLRSGKLNLYQRLSNGGGEDELFFKPDEDIYPLSWSRNGRFLGVGAVGADLQTRWVIPLDDKGKPAGKPVLFGQRGLGLGVEFSPEANGPPRWVAYQATRDGSTEVYLWEFDPNSPTLIPADAGEWQVSKGGGSAPHWNPNGKELFYLAPDRTLMAVDVTGNKKAPTGVPQPQFKPMGIDRTSQAGVATLSWDVSDDGKRFLFPIPITTGQATPPLSVIVNWMSLLKQ